MLATLTEPQACEREGSSGSASSVPSYSLKWPRTVEIIRCRTSNPTLEWDGSTFHVPAGTRTMPRSVCSIVIGPFLRSSLQRLE